MSRWPAWLKKGYQNNPHGCCKGRKTHVGEFQALLLRFDTQQKKELEAGAEEVEEELSK